MDSIYFEDPLGLLIELASYRFEPPDGFTHADVLLEAHKLRVERERLQHRPGASRRRDRAARHALARVPLRRPLAEAPVPRRGRTYGCVHAEHPQAEREQPDASGSSCGPPGSSSRSRTSGARRRRPEYLAKYPAHLTPMLEAEELPRGALGESCAIMAYLCNKHGLDRFYPTDPGERAMVDNAMFYLIGTFYPLAHAGDVPDARLRRSTRARWARPTPTTS